MRFPIGLMLSAVCLFAAGPSNPALQQVHNVYLLPMGSGLDQYLANRLTSTGLFLVVTDPQKADAILTETVGAGLEKKLAELYPPPAPPKADDKDAKDKDKDPFEKPVQHSIGISRGRGTVFIVDRNSRAVLWSVYRPVKSSRPDDTNRRADDIIKQLEKDLKGK